MSLLLLPSFPFLIVFCGLSGSVAAAYYDSGDSTLYLLEDTYDGHHLDLTKLRKCPFFSLRAFLRGFRAVLEQVKPDYILTSSRADEALIRECQLYGTCIAIRNTLAHPISTADEASAHLQVRPHREYQSQPGHERLLSLHIFNFSQERPAPDIDVDSNHASRNAYSFMQSRSSHQSNGISNRQHASLRAQSFGNMASPLCVSDDFHKTGVF